VSFYESDYDERELGPGCERNADAAAYVLGALDAHELPSFREHLQECAICQGEVAQLQKVADALAVGVAHKPAPDSLRARIMATAHAEAELSGPPATTPIAPRGRHCRAGAGVWCRRWAPLSLSEWAC
jgi:anti-sigma factor RsiW